MTDRRRNPFSTWGVLILLLGAVVLWRDAATGLAPLGQLARDLASPGPWLSANGWYLIRSAGVAFALVLVSDAVGMRAGRWWLGTRPTGAVRWAMPLVGHFVVSTLLLGLAALGGWTAGWLLGGTALVVTVCAGDIGASAGSWRDGAREAWGALPRTARVPAMVGLGIAAIVSAPPETGIDALAYHLAFPDQLLVTHRLFGADGYSHWLFPLPVELPSVYALLAAADTAVVWTGGAMLIAGGAAAARACGAGAQAPWLAAGVALVSGPRWMLLTAKNDAHVAGLVLAAGALLVAGGPLRRTRPRRAVVALGGLLLGVTVAAKYVLLPHAVVLGIVAVWRSRPVDRATVLGLLCAGAAPPLAPWLVKGWCYLADPFYPMGSALFPAIFGDPGTNAMRRTLLDQHVRDPAHAVVVPGMIARLVAFDLPVLIAGAPWIRSALATGGAGLAAAGVAAVLAAPVLLRGDFATVERYAFPALVLANLAGAVALARARSRGAPAALAALLVLGSLRLPADDVGGRAGAFIAGTRPPGAYRAATVSPRAGLETALRTLPRGGGGVILAVGELDLQGLPRRVRMQLFEPPLAWTASRDAADWRRIAIRFRQSDIRWILYNQPLARLEASQRRPYVWTPAQVRRYADFAVRHIRVGAFCGVAVPGWGSTWWLEVSRRSLAPAVRIPFLPGAEAAFASAVLADDHDDPRWAAEWWKGWRGLLPDVAWLDGRLGGSLLRMGKAREAYPLLRTVAAEWPVDEALLPDLALAAHRTGRAAEARAALGRAEAMLSGWPGRLESVKREIMVPR